jgi:uncharacterized protein YjeT (DUF2065 family)
MTSIPEQRLFTRIVRLTLLRGIVIGIWGILTGLWIYNFIQRFFLWESVPFFFEGPLAPPYVMLSGAIIVLQGEVTRLCSPFLALSQERNGVWNLNNFSKHFLRLMGSFFMLMGFVLLLWKPLRFPNPTVSDAQQTSVPTFLSLIFVGIFLSIGGISWYFSLRDKLRGVQKEREEKSLSAQERKRSLRYVSPTN